MDKMFKRLNLMIVGGVSALALALPAPSGAVVGAPDRGVAPKVVPSKTAAAAAPRAASRYDGTLTLGRIGKIDVPVSSVGLTGYGAVAVPGNVHALGRWDGSQTFGAREGSSIIVGHVSDYHDNPGALYRLPWMKIGDRIIWKKGKTKKVFRVSQKTLTLRSGELPERIWALTGKRTINIVSCTAKVVSPDGYFHYTRNITVTAKLVRTVKMK